jgi:hypothetical protein
LEEADELDDSSGSFGQFAQDLISLLDQSPAGVRHRSALDGCRAASNADAAAFSI